MSVGVEFDWNVAQGGRATSMIGRLHAAKVSPVLSDTESKSQARANLHATRFALRIQAAMQVRADMKRMQTGACVGLAPPCPAVSQSSEERPPRPEVIVSQHSYRLSPARGQQRRLIRRKS